MPKVMKHKWGYIVSKVGIITLNGYFNYGNRLQNFALQQVLLKFFDEVETIWYTDKEYIPMQFQWNVKMLIKYLLNRNGFQDYCRNEMYICDVFRNYKLKSFTEKYINTRYIYSTPNKDFADEYDFFVVGSDQIWNPLFITGDVEFLTFAEKHKRVAYAPSIVKEKFTYKEKLKYTSLLNGMEYISVREKSDADMVKALIKKDVPVLIDPVMLLSSQEWKSLESEKMLVQEKYIFVFLLGETTFDMHEEISTISRLYHLKIVTFNDRNNVDIYSSSIEEWIRLIDNASLVYTDSFHAIAFSILFNTPFIAKNRSTLSATDVRIFTLTKKFNMENRICESFDDLKLRKNLMEMDFSCVNDVLDNEKVKSMTYLNEAFGRNKK